VDKLTLVLGLGLLAAGEGGQGDQGSKGKAKVELSKDEKALFDLLNKERAKEKLPALKLNAALCEAAQKHCANMAKQGKMAHRLDDKGVGDRVTAAGYDWRIVRENLGRAAGEPGGPAPAPADVHKRWMESKGHRANILNDRVTEVGLSMVKGKKGTFYYAQVFAEPRK
jgi:uncharacterized protein YkwD